MKPIKIGVIGCGYWGPKLARNFHELPETELLWAADSRADRLAAIKSAYPDVRTTQDYCDLLRSDVDAVIIATPVSTHYKLAIEALHSGKHVFVEKPLAAHSSEAREIAETGDRLGLVAMVGHTFQYNPAVNVVRDLIASGELGQVYYINSTRVNLGLYQPDIDVIWDLAPHDISIMLHILGLDPLSVRAYGNACVQRVPLVHDVAYVAMQFPEGVLVNMRLSWLDPVKVRRLTVVGSKKMLVYDDVADDKVTLFDKGVELLSSPNGLEAFHMSYRNGNETVVPCEWREPLRLECEAFANWIDTGQPACSDAWVGLRVVQVLEAAQESLLDGGSMIRVKP
jgi:predicted dehydrogenase